MADLDALQTKEAQKTVIAFVAGLLIGGLLVWVFSEPSPGVNDDANDDRAEEQRSDEALTGDASDDTDEEDAAAADDDDAEEIATLPTGDGSVDVTDQTAGNRVALGGAVFPTDEGWVGVRDYDNGEIGNILGVARYSKAQGLVPSEIGLVRPTISGEEYAIVFFNENGDRAFNPASDTRIEGIADTFTAQ